MCGIFGLMRYESHRSPLTEHKAGQYRTFITKLATESEQRGPISSGICALIGNEYYLYKAMLPARELVNRDEFREILNLIRPGKKFKALIGHTRQPTKGSAEINHNNHPIIANKVIGVHNGFISNDDYLFNQFGDNMERAGQVDSEIIFRLIDMYSRGGLTLTNAVKAATEDLYGSYACAFMHREYPDYVTLFREGNWGGISINHYKSPLTIAFASTPAILRYAGLGLPLLATKRATHQAEVVGDKGMRINLVDGSLKLFDINSGIPHRIRRKKHRGQNTLQNILENHSTNRKCCVEEFGGSRGNCDSICFACNYYMEDQGDF